MILEPWPHIIIDDFLPEEEFIRLSNHCQRSFKNLPEKIHYAHGEQVQRWHLNYDPIAHHDMTQYLKFFNHREYSKLRSIVHYVNTKANFTHPMHTDAPYKILSSILYLSPEVNNGTNLFKSERGFYNEMVAVKWKPNRMLIFAGQDNVTWHDYTSNEVDRYTFNHYLVEPSAITNESYKTLHFKIH